MSKTTTIRVSKTTHQALIKIAEEESTSIVDVLDRIMKEEATRSFFKKMEEAHKRDAGAIKKEYEACGC